MKEIEENTMNLRIPLSLYSVFLMIMMLGSTAHAESEPFGTAGQMSPYGQFSLQYGQENRNLGGYSTGASTSEIAAVASTILNSIIFQSAARFS